MNCPKYQSESIIKNGFNSLNKQIYRCKTCGRQFVLNPSKMAISQGTKERVDRLLLERNLLRNIQRCILVQYGVLFIIIMPHYEKG
ncbi:IS1 family transposase [Thiospirillum jenense]|uniref:IS1 family transposase n=1 Tax=Thiospirillum jenense TaxID=1653858 RepID=A0A839HJX9_9GAMM|nr:IS1 family transposase [Thiospirillum jenense]